MGERPLIVGPRRDPVDLAHWLEAAYPALAPAIQSRPEDVAYIASSGRGARDARTYRKLLLPSLDLRDPAGVRRKLRRFAARERLRIAARELETTAADVDVTAKELADLADVCVEVALNEALLWADLRYGIPTKTDGSRNGFCVIGMGKLGGRELNAGSDIDLLLFYDTDEGAVVKDGVVQEVSLHEYFTRVAQRLTSTLDEPTEDGLVWRVDLRLRPEGSRGPLVNALAAAERYYESWGRTWERAALVRARPSAGDLAVGEQVLGALAPFVWRREVNPQVADEMAAMLLRARAEIGEAEPRRDLKLGPGGIREAEFFVQSLQLVWGGREPTVRSTNTLDALRRLRARGFVTEREAREVGDGYLALRRLEHRVQFATGLQTHAVPEDPVLLGRIARSLGFRGALQLEKDLDRVRKRIGARMASLTRHGLVEKGEPSHSLERLLSALDARDEPRLLASLEERFDPIRAPDLARHLLTLAKRPDGPLGARSRDQYPELAATLIDALADAADPEQAARLMATFFARMVTPSLYVRAMAEDQLGTRRLAGLFGASAFLGEAAALHPDLVDRLLFRAMAGPIDAARTVDVELEQLGDLDAIPDPVARLDSFVGALRRAKRGVTMEVGVADLAGELDTRKCTLTLSIFADFVLQHTTRFALASGNGGARAEGQPAPKIAVIAMGKLGGREIGYGSDLDLIFVYDPAGQDEDEAQEQSIRAAQRVLRILSMPHVDGPGYELDTRLRPSGNHGLLVVSIEAFARYQETQAAAWERQALIKARACAGDEALGARVMAIAAEAAYERGAAPAAEVHRLRMRMERELAGERRGGARARYDMKLGYGGLVDVEFAVQYLQMVHGRDRRVRTQDTEAALGALEACGYMDSTVAASLREGYRLLRQLEQRARVHHGSTNPFIEEGAPGLTLLARRMGMRDGRPRGSAAEALLARYVHVTHEVRAAYLTVLGIASEG
ncbi:bifunctional [glutamate--ammonia ligase]-adenylyl-L-tyrosine phosphorylase/[glutamate--ammonia-ligase] adenylyltransferase [Pendulispora albinea]|uniref:Bifunctional [glutamate--ammonia ligase]-adenylyl-L-tyrosine phosphorylase/[glutamate--ammonia-ligase] adenylyltransferase n=1 Tax=Pendulispora albinea TaxID=2741071 RepID=A0ABZ2M662_9BACT